MHLGSNVLTERKGLNMRYEKPSVNNTGKKGLPTAANFAPPPTEEQGIVAKAQKRPKDSQLYDCKKK